MKTKYAFVIEPLEHAELSASSAERWTTCPGSVTLSAGVPNSSSAFAAGGSAAHYIGAQCLIEGDNPANWLGQLALVEGHEIALDEELVLAVQEYVDYIRGDEQLGDEGSIEQSFTQAMRKLHPKFGGSTDYVRWRSSTRHLRIVDYKHGAGVPVDVDDNKQLKYYALGALLSNPQWNAETVEIVIVQPRCDHEQGRIRTFEFPAIDLLEFAADLLDAAKRTEEFGADLVPSKKACKWCPANAANKCPAIQQETHAITRADFDVIDPASYSLDQIAEFLTKVPLVEARIAAVREYAYQRACAGENVPGWKLVDKRATRKWRDEDAIVAAGVSPELLTKPELRSPAQVEKILGKKRFAKEFGEHVVKESSGHTLAPADDPRPPSQVALLTDFKPVQE